MNKLIVLIFLMMMSLKGFSQNAIDTTSIQLKKPIARLVIKDLIKGDGANEELALNKQKIRLLENKISLKDSVIVSLENSEQSDKFNSFGKQLAMHIAASNPIALTSDKIILLNFNYNKAKELNKL